MKSKNAILFLVIVLLIASNALLLYKNDQLKSGYSFNLELGARRENAKKLNNQTIPAAAGYRPIHPGGGSLVENIRKNDYSLVVLFEPSQCGSCLNEKILWNAVHDQGILPVYGVTSLSDSKELSQFLKQSEVHIPIYQDSSAELGRWLKPAGVPVKLLVDKNLNIQWCDYVRETADDREDFTRLLKHYLSANF
jgi:hypothetical protein